MFKGRGRVELCWERGLPLVGTDPAQGFGDIVEGPGTSYWVVGSASPWGCCRLAGEGVWLGAVFPWQGAERWVPPYPKLWVSAVEAPQRRASTHTSVIVAAVREPEGCGACTSESRAPEN